MRRAILAHGCLDGGEVVDFLATDETLEGSPRQGLSLSAMLTILLEDSTDVIVSASAASAAQHACKHEYVPGTSLLPVFTGLEHA